VHPVLVEHSSELFEHVEHVHNQTSSNMFRSIKPRGHVVPVEGMSDLMPLAPIIVRRHDLTVKTCPIPCSLATIIVSEQELTVKTCPIPCSLATIIVSEQELTVKTCPIPCSLATIIVSEQELTGYTKVHLSFVLHETMQRTLCAPGF
jgi:hypothetical protein